MTPSSSFSSRKYILRHVLQEVFALSAFAHASTLKVVEGLVEHVFEYEASRENEGPTEKDDDSDDVQVVGSSTAASSSSSAPAAPKAAPVVAAAVSASEEVPRL
jgi:hypothetical protein